MKEKYKSWFWTLYANANRPTREETKKLEEILFDKDTTEYEATKALLLYCPMEVIVAWRKKCEPLFRERGVGTYP